jgi:uncharacterized protein (TIGR03435 family)
LRGCPAVRLLYNSAFTAVESQLGLKLELRKVPAEIVVADKAEEAPVAN